MDSDSPALTDLNAAFPHDKWAWLRVTVRVALERRPDAATVRLTVADLGDGERTAIRWLLKLADLPSDVVKVSVRRLDAALAERTDVGMDTRSLLETLDGPLDNLRQDRCDAQHAKDEAWTRIVERARSLEDSAILRWLEAEQARGSLPADPAVRERLLTDVLDVLAHLPLPGRTPLTVLAATSLGAAHALDQGFTASLVLRALAYRQSQPPPINGQQERMLWNSVGVVPDDLSSRVLVHGFRPPGSGFLATLLRSSTEEAMPCVITLQQLDRHFQHHAGTLLPPNTKVWACENVAVISAAAEHLGATCPPLICVEGWPSAAAALLIEHLTQGGIELHYHGDFDKAGLEITSRLIETGAKPWRMRATDYTSAVATRPRLPRIGQLIDRCDWSQDLATALRSHRLQLEEEHVVDRLLEDLELARIGGGGGSVGAGVPAVEGPGLVGSGDVWC